MITNEKIIGIVAGVGPFAGLDLLSKVLAETAAARDQDHLPILSLSWPSQIPDRTEYLLGQTAVNPAFPMVEQLRLLEQMGATVAAIPCNTAHVPPIFDAILSELQTAGSRLKLLHMIGEVVTFLKQHYPTLQRVGVLSTTGTYRAAVYPSILEPAGFRVVVPDEGMQVELIHAAVYHPGYGLKAHGHATTTARKNLLTGVHALRQQGAEAIVLGCTEMPLALAGPTVEGLPLIDATRILARALIREVDPTKLKAWE